MPTPSTVIPFAPTDPRVRGLVAELATLASDQAAERLAVERDEDIARTLEALNPVIAVHVLWSFTEERRERVLANASPAWATQWRVNKRYPGGTIGRLMTPALAEFLPTMTVAQAIEEVREIARRALVSYAFVIDTDRKLLGVLVFRDMMLADPAASLAQVMIPNPIALEATMPIMDGMREALKWHFPSYPICDEAGRLVGTVRGQTLFQQQAFELSAQAGTMVGVQKEERLATPWPTSFRFRHPWLQLNLLTAFAAAGVVGFFQGTIDRVVVLAVFLPVLAGQSGNTGCQALAVTLRGMTLGELKSGHAKRLILKEAWLGLLNGALVGVSAGIGMLIYASSEKLASATMLGFVVTLAMTVACITSGVAGVVVPVVLPRLGADPATASSIFLTTATDCASMGVFLGLATLLVP